MLPRTLTLSLSRTRDSVSPGLLGFPRRPSVARAAWSYEGNRKDGDHAARASGGLLPNRERCTGSLSPWIARYDNVREGTQSRRARGTHCQTQHVLEGVFEEGSVIPPDYIRTIRARWDLTTIAVPRW